MNSFFDIRDRLHNLELKVVDTISYESLCDGDCKLGHVIEVKSEDLHRDWLAILLQRAGCANVFKGADSNLQLLIFTLLLESCDRMTIVELQEQFIDTV